MTKVADNSQPIDNPRKRKRSSSGDGGKSSVAPSRKSMATDDTITFTSPKKHIITPRKATAKPQDLTKELKELRKDYAQVQSENDKLKERNKILEEAREADAEKILLDAGGLAESTTCEICESSLWSPFLLTDCGHTFCQSCIEKWFSQALAKYVAAHPGYDINFGVYRMSAAGEHPEHPSYVCLKCRAAVSSRPVENFSLKSLVRNISAATGEKSPKKLKKKRNQRKKGINGRTWDRFFGKS